MTPEIEEFSPEHPAWKIYVGHLERAKMLSWVLDENNQPISSEIFLGIRGMGRIIGHISLGIQDIEVPPTKASGGKPVPICGIDGTPLKEMFVQTFFVDPEHRRKGYGGALQRRALDYAARHNCHQLRSWASLDRQANYALKIKLGFAVDPAIYQMQDGRRISGAHFIQGRHQKPTPRKPVNRYAPDRPGWDQYVAHLERAEAIKSVLEADGTPKPNLYFMGVENDERVVGHIAMIRQETLIPPSEWSGNEPTPMLDEDGNPVQELFVKSFAVELDERRKGYGSAMQQAGIALTRELDCHQLRSWSPLESLANNALKIKLGFAIHPSNEDPQGHEIGGAYFVKSV